MAYLDDKARRPEGSSDTHQTIQDLMPLYATMAAQGNPPERAYPQVADHVARCEQCRAELEELLDISTAAFGGRVPQAPVHRQPDLSFLPSRQPARAWAFDAAGRLVISFSQALLALLQPPQLVGLARGRLLYRYALEPGAIPNLTIMIEVFAVDQQPALANVRVHVELLDRDVFEQGVSTVALRLAGAQWSAPVNDSGDAVFEHLPLELIPELRAEISLAPPVGQ